MKYKHFYRAILFRIITIVIFSGLATWLYFQKELYALSILLALVVILLVINTVRYFNNINRWIAFFLLGIENEDTTLKIPTKTGSKAIDDVFKGMERLNELFKQTKIDISTHEQYFKMVINQSATGLFSVNEKGRIINLNPTAEKLTSLKQYHHINALLSVDKALPDFIMQMPEKRSQQSVIFENKYGQKLLFKLSEIKMAKEVIRLVAVSDITKELDNGEVDAWIKLARTLSHEIMNNIAPITTLSQVLTGYFQKNNQIIEVKDVDHKMIANTVKGLEVIEERSIGLMNFVDNYRKFTKLPEPQFKETNVTDLLENSIMACCAFQGSYTIKLEKSIPQNIWVVTDENLLSQVIINLLKNAIEALALEKIEAPRLIIKLKIYENSYSVEFHNNGPQIPNDIKEQIFVPFFTTKEEGSGIGLSLSKQIMLKMGGDILLKSHDEIWTTFVINFPKI